MKRHLAEVADAVEVVCKEQKGRTLRQMVTALVTAFHEAKMKNGKTSVALYSVSSDVDGAKIARQMASRFHKAIVRMLASASQPLTADPQIVASMLEGMMVGVSRGMLESGAPEKELDAFRRELILVACAYIDACSARAPLQDEGRAAKAEKLAAVPQ